MGGVTLSYVCPHRNSLKGCIWWVSTGHGGYRKKKHCSWWCAVCGGKYESRVPNRILSARYRRQRSKGVQSARGATRVVRKPDQSAQAAGEPGDGWRLPDSEHCDGPARKKQKRYHGRGEERHRSRQRTLLIYANVYGFFLSRSRNAVKITQRPQGKEQML